MTDMDTAWAVTARGPLRRTLEVSELEERLHDELLCEGTAMAHGPDVCGIIATHRIRATCPGHNRTVHICRPLAAWAVTDTHPCVCGRPANQCWVVTKL